MTTTWIVLADEGRARILSAEDHAATLQDVERLDDPAAHAHNADFRHDARGRRNPAGGVVGAGGAGSGAGGAGPNAGGHGSASQPGSDAASAGEEKLDHEAELFARRIALRLAEAHRQHRYDRLRIAAAPKFLGRLRRVLDDEVRGTVDEEIDKDLLQLDRDDLSRRFLHPPGGRTNG